MTTATRKKKETIVVSALNARTNFGRLLRRIDVEHRSLVIEKRGAPAAVLMNIRDYVKLAAPEPEVLKIIGNEAVESGKNTMSAREIEQTIKAARSAKRKR